jgi:hypothetical protein
MSRRTSRSQYRLRYGQPLGNDGVSVDLFAILCAISATKILIICLLQNSYLKIFFKKVVAVNALIFFISYLKIF